MRIDRIESLSKDHDLGGLPMISSDLLTYDFDQHPFPPPPVDSIEDSLPGAKIETAVGDGDHGFAAHNAQLVAVLRFRCASAACPFIQDRRLHLCGCAGID
jgi:hypothetical protein